MSVVEAEWHVLAARVRRGIAGAEGEWRRAFAPQLGRIVRRVIRRGPAGAGFTRRIAATGAALRRRDLVPSEALAGELARRLGEAVLRGLQRGDRPGGALVDTVQDGTRRHSAIGG